MLKEMTKVSQVPGEPRRRWFSSAAFDLIVWFDAADAIGGFQLCYDREKDEKVLTWKAPDEYSHMAVDDGEGRAGRHKASPILVPGKAFKPGDLAEKFRREAAEVPFGIANLVIAKIAGYRPPESR
ncbi:MAG: hypothetical protein ACHQ51_02180 [Elusimicrobiota bacterium]